MEFWWNNFPDPGDRFRLGFKLGSGVGGQVYEAYDNKGGRKVAIKIININHERETEIKAEKRIFETFSKQNFAIPGYYGIFYKKGRADIHQIWIAMELCERGSVKDYILSLQGENKRMPEDHIAYILKEVIKVITVLHENEIIHRDIRAANILITNNGEIKLCDFGLSTHTVEKLKTRIGSPSWIAPEVVMQSGYDSRADVWSLGITAIELGDKQAPFEEIHPTRALFQIVRNPPPTLYRQSYWSQLYNDFISECLEKSSENRPHSQELLEHPFFSTIEGEEARIRNEISHYASKPNIEKKMPDVMIKNNELIIENQMQSERLLQEDLSVLELITDDTILAEVQQRFQFKKFYTFVGDVLLCMNPNQNLDIYGGDCHQKYELKARSDNAPHIYSVADKAYQDVLHNEAPQYILMSGEAVSGKTINMLHLTDHLLFLGKGNRTIRKGIEIIHALGNSGMPSNPNSTRHILQTQFWFSKSGRISGGKLNLYLLEKLRVTNCDRNNANFHVFYYFYDAMVSSGSLLLYNLDEGRDYQYLRTGHSYTGKQGPREKPHDNVKQFKNFENNLKELSFQDFHLTTIRKTLAAILLLGEIQFTENSKIINENVAESVSNLLGLDYEKFKWYLLNYCVINKEEKSQKKMTLEESMQVRDVLSQTLYQRLVDWILHRINDLLLSQATIGEKFVVTVMDQFGMECLPKNCLEQLFTNISNEQLQFYYNHHAFVWEMEDSAADEITVVPLSYYDNKIAVDQLMSKTDGLLQILDDVTKTRKVAQLPEKLRKLKKPYINVPNTWEFVVAHYAGRVIYDLNELVVKNRDFMPPEMTETLRNSSNAIIQKIFTEPLNKTGNLILPSEPNLFSKRKGHWEKPFTLKNQNQNTDKYSQIRQMRTLIGIFRSTWLEILKQLGTGQNGVHFVKCIRPSLSDQPGSFQPELVLQQLKALAIIDTAKAKQQGYSVRVSFKEFLRRYQFLAFDFDEEIDMTKENCRLLLLRLKMEGWMIGKTKVFMKYYNEEYLSRLYETHVKKIIKVQSMMRTFLVKRNFKGKMTSMKKPQKKPIEHQESKEPAVNNLSEEEAATIIQKQFRGIQARKDYVCRVKSEIMTEDDKNLAKKFIKIWSQKSIYQILLNYRSNRFQDLIYFCQQVHIYNQSYLSEINDQIEGVNQSKIDPTAKPKTYLPQIPAAVRKIPFRLDQFQFVDNSLICDPFRSKSLLQGSEESSWDSPLRRNFALIGYSVQDKSVQTNEEGKYRNSSAIDTPFIREFPSQGRLDLSGGKMDKAQVYKAPRVPALAPPQTAAKKNVKIRDDNHVKAIKELEARFQRTTSDDNEDAPPFNFQAMLRKTNTNRESLRRPNVVFNSNATDYTKHNSNKQSIKQNITRTELAPGIVAIGQVADI